MVWGCLFSQHANLLLLLLLPFSCTTESPQKATSPIVDLQKAAVGAFAAFTIASSSLTAPPANAISSVLSTSTTVAEKVTREGIYGEYTVDLVQQYDDARSTFKTADETKTKKGKWMLCE
jgi:hypothetical protein